MHVKVLDVTGCITVAFIAYKSYFTVDETFRNLIGCTVFLTSGECFIEGRSVELNIIKSRLSDG